MSTVTGCRPNARVTSLTTDSLATRISPDKMPVSGFSRFKFSRCAVSNNEDEPRFSLLVSVYYKDTNIA